MTITTLPTPPTRQDPANFAAQGDAFLAALPAFGAELSALQTDVNAKHTATNIAASTASAASLNADQQAALATSAAASALAVLGYKGAWSGLTGALNMPASVLHSGGLWMLVSNLANVTTATPGISAAWVAVASTSGAIIGTPISGSTGSFTTLAASGAFSLTGDQVQVSEGGTGATTAATARANLGAAPTASPSFTGPVSIVTSGSEGRIFAGTSDGYFYANATGVGWYSPTLGSFQYFFSDDQFYINGHTAWHHGNDGDGSGLDADLLDGQQGSYYAPTANATLTGVTKAQNITVTDMTLKINPAATGAGYGVIHRNDGANYYLLLTNLNDALGGYNALRPMSMNCATGAINFDIVSAPTQAPGNNSTLLATTAFTKAAVDAAAPVAPGSAPKYACRAWVNFNGTGTPAIRASGNVSSITDNGLGDYTVNFTTAMPDANYAANANIYGLDGARSFSSTIRYESLLSTSFQVTVGRSDNTGGFIHGDSSTITVSIFR